MRERFDFHVVFVAIDQRSHDEQVRLRRLSHETHASDHLIKSSPG